jgi:2-keto-3-deoxy-6-phosphogluconate aldolase
MGCRAMEVTLDSGDWKAVLSGLRAALPPHVLLGVGTVMDDTVSQLAVVKALGGTFALSPIDPTGFLEECHRLGMLAIPSAFTSNECWSLHRRGCRLIKLFHAGLASPSILKSILDVSPLGQHLNIPPSGGVSPSNAQQWWDAGAACVGMGSNLVGKDISVPSGSPAFEAAVTDWTAKGRNIAVELFTQVATRFPPPAL